MNATVRPMPLYYSPLHKLLDDHGVHTIRRLRELTGLSSQQCWNLWHGKVGVGRKTAQLLHERCGIPYEALMRLPSVPKPKPKSTRPPEEEGPADD
jgi:hypothetical protein